MLEHVSLSGTSPFGYHRGVPLGWYDSPFSSSTLDVLMPMIVSKHGIRFNSGRKNYFHKHARYNSSYFKPHWHLISRSFSALDISPPREVSL
jgi:hypothetical protein